MSKRISRLEREELEGLSQNVTEDSLLIPDEFVNLLVLRIIRYFFTVDFRGYSNTDFHSDLKFLCKIIINTLENK